METGQGTTDQTKGINNSIRGAAVAVGLKPETVKKFLPLMRSYEIGDMISMDYEQLSEENNRLGKFIRSLQDEKEYLLQRIDELSNTVRKQHEEAVKLQRDVLKAQGK
jgi:hypothetical protein